MKFSTLDLHPLLEQAVVACGFSEMTPVQELSMPKARRGKDLLVHAQTGTGKTAAFGLPILQQMLDAPKETVSSSPRALILTPTRELAEQLADAIGSYAQFTELTVTALYGGVKLGGQTSKLKKGTDILIATPGRLLEHMALNNVTLANAEFVVLDEADRMLDMGFITDVSQIMQHTAKKRQTLLYSATSSPAVNELCHKILSNHVEIRVSKANATADTVNHVMYPVEESRKIDLFKALLKEQNWFQVLVFTSTKEQADKLMAALKQSKIDAAVCHGDKSQGSRRRALADFKSAKLQVLISTEVAARGLDIQGLDFVVNYNLPYLPEDYVHRIGRTGRAGNTGNAISFVSREEERTVSRIEALIGSSIKRVVKKGFEVSDRQSLLKSISRNGRPSKTNKVSKTQITGDSVKAKRRSPSKRK
ncbi:DEAD/DEAH box helicase [Brumicola nitratireducens]|uniref:DEAD/DEAH box helicase-like protein n=1 Tax=Glaciecola nitratireducens (strain JCM 12485 / KCTC 12276 / FR1064) TaxID=1085623 RepID=G4QIE4_GLANF|nr:DEAD/DEAH box helicase [Glaciecola nitratireducens]AEP30858.1 DEAD/DEAH box helicase-like protein [Glaciecola nitratireducens FR1064]